MIKPVQALYHVIVSPINFVSFYRYQSPLKLGLLVMALVSAAKLPSVYNTQIGLVSDWIMLMLGYSILLGLQAMSTDFFAQMLHLNGKSLTLFSWFSIALLPLCLEPVIFLLSVSIPLSHLWISVNTLLGFWVIIWQIYMIKQVYQSSVRLSVLLYVLPIVFLVIIAGFIALLGAATLQVFDV